MKTQNEIVALLQKTYPKINKSTVSMAMHAEEYGIQFSPEAARLISLPTKSRKSTPERRTKQNRLSVRVSDEDYLLVKQQMENLGFKTVQEYLESIIKEER